MKKIKITILIIICLFISSIVYADENDYIKKIKEHIVEGEIIYADDNYIYALHSLEYHNKYGILKYDHEYNLISTTKSFFYNTSIIIDKYIITYDEENNIVYKYDLEGHLIKQVDLMSDTPYYNFFRINKDEIVLLDEWQNFVFFDKDLNYKKCDVEQILNDKYPETFNTFKPFVTIDKDKIVLLQVVSNTFYVIDRSTYEVTIDNNYNINDCIELYFFSNNKYDYYMKILQIGEVPTFMKIVVKKGNEVINSIDITEETRTFACNNYYCMSVTNEEIEIYDLEFRNKLQSNPVENFVERFSVVPHDKYFYTSEIYTDFTTESGFGYYRTYSFDLDEKEKEIYVNETTSIEDIIGENLDDYEITVDNSGIIEIDNKTIKALSNGEALIEIRNDNRYYQIKVIVKDIINNNEDDIINPKTGIFSGSVIIVIILLFSYIGYKRLENSKTFPF